MQQGIAPGALPLVPDAASDIIQQIQYLHQRVREAAEDYEKMKQEQESFAIQYHECAKLNGGWAVVLDVLMNVQTLSRVFCWE